MGEDIDIGSRVLYKNENPGTVVNIDSPLGWREFTVKLDNGLVRICAKYLLSKLPAEPQPQDTQVQACDCDCDIDTGSDVANDSFEKDNSWIFEIDLSNENGQASTIIETHNLDRTVTSEQNVMRLPNVQTSPIPGTSGTAAKANNSSTDSRFKSVTSEDVSNFVRDNENKKTAAKTKQHVKLVTEYFTSVGEDRDLHDIPPHDLDPLLSRFFLAVRQKNGKEYEPGTLRDILSSIQRHLNRQSYGILLTEDIRFQAMRETLRSKQKELKSQGLGNRAKKAEALTSEEVDMLYLHGQLGLSSPGSLLNTLWFNNCVYFGLRGGKEEHRRIRWGDISLHCDSSGAEYLEFSERQSKTRTGEDIRNIRKMCPRAWANPENPDRCPVAAYKLYAEKRPVDFCNPDDPYYIATVTNDKYPAKSARWFLRQPVGVNKLSSLMRNMAKGAGLSDSKRLTNHSARKYLVQQLSDQNIPPTHIMQITGHKNINSINNYSEISSNNQQRISHILSGRAMEQVPPALPTLPSAPPAIPPRPENHVLMTSQASASADHGVFHNCQIGKIIIQNYYGNGASPVKRRRCIIYSDSDNSHSV